MKNNRRNYYRILHVQPEAPAEIIKASYRTLMSTLKMHPDLGGDHATAALINEAYAVLSDRARRSAYDRQLETRGLRGRAQSAGRSQASGATGGHAPHAGMADTGGDDGGCPWCQAPLPARIVADTRCAACRAPLAPPPAPGEQGRELFGRRASMRSPRAQLAIMTVRGQSTGLSIRLRDLSLTGISLLATTAVAAGSRVRIQAPDFEAVASVVSSRRARETHVVHARLQTMAFTRRSGVFVSETA